MKKLIYTSYASNNSVGNPTYLRCCVVSLISFRVLNPDDDIYLFTNISLDKKYVDILSKNRINVRIVQFDSFVFPEDMLWSLAFYKLCVLHYVVNNLEYDQILGVDSDTYCIKNLQELWVETNENILLYNLEHSYLHPQSVQMDKEYYNLIGHTKHLTNYGGEFVAGPRSLLRILTDKCFEIYLKMKESGTKTMHGDESILCAAAQELKEYIETGNAYLFRFFTGRFYLSSTVYRYNQVAIMHLPSEKNNGFRMVYQYYINNGSLPSHKKLLKMMEIQTAERPFNIYRLHYIIWLLAKRIRKKLNRQ